MGHFRSDPVSESRDRCAGCEVAIWRTSRVIGALFEGQSAGYSMLAAGVLLAIMVIPFITAVTRDILRAIPRSQREGSYALGATQWETISQVVIPYAKSGIIGAVVLGLGRALGETMAVTMVIGNQSPNTPSGISLSLLSIGLHDVQRAGEQV